MLKRWRMRTKKAHKGINKSRIMNINKRKVELFTAGCPVCEPLVKMVKSIACESCDVVIYDLSKPCESKICLDKAKEYEIKSLPAIAVNGKLLDCCTRKELTKEDLQKAGIGIA